MKTNELFFHGRTTDGRRFTICGLIKRGRIRVSASLCSFNDNFCRKIGREIAKGRLAKQKAYTKVKCDKREPIKSFVEYGTQLSRLSSPEFLTTFNLKS